MTEAEYQSLRGLCETGAESVQISASNLKTLFNTVNCLSQEVALCRRILVGIHLFNGTEDAGLAMKIWNDNIGEELKKSLGIGKDKVKDKATDTDSVSEKKPGPETEENE
jgi:hypothetical protein